MIFDLFKKKKKINLKDELYLRRKKNAHLDNGGCVYCSNEARERILKRMGADWLFTALLYSPACPLSTEEINRGNVDDIIGNIKIK